MKLRRSERIAIWLLFTFCFCGACAYQAKQDKHEETKIDSGGSQVVEQEPSTKDTYSPATYPGQPLQDRLQSHQVKGAKHTTLEDWQKTSMGSDEHLEAKANVGPKGLEWLFIAGGIAAVVAIAGGALWKMRPPWLRLLFPGKAPGPPPPA